MNEIIHGDCLEIMLQIPTGSVDMILCDLPFEKLSDTGNSFSKWDKIIPFEPLWKQYERIIKENGAIVLFGSQPFSSELIMSNYKLFKYEWIWKKNRPTGFTHAKNKPLTEHENILVFSKGTTVHENQSSNRMPYYPQGLVITNKALKINKTKHNGGVTGVRANQEGREYIQEFTNYPRSVFEFSKDKETYHTSQKPVALCEFLIKSYTTEGEVVLDNCIGSGTTAVAALSCGRNFIGIEKELEYVEIARKRLQCVQPVMNF